MDKNIVFWNPWWDKNFEGIEIKQRKRFNDIYALLDRKEVVLINGVRRSGKTYSFYYIINQLIKRGTPIENILFLNLDDEVLENEKLEDIYQTYKKLFPRIKGKMYLFLDEIQNIQGWERWVKNKYDSFEDIKIFIGGSNSYLLQNKSSTLLTGRLLNINFFPLTFEEYLEFRDIDIRSKILMLKNESLIKNEFNNYLKFGGFPEVVLEQDERLKIMLLKSYFENIRDKDIIRVFGIKEIKKFERVLFYLISNVSKFMSAKKIGVFCELSTGVVNNYLDYIELVYFFLYLKNFSYSIKGQITSARKTYAIDTGFVNAISFKFSENIGRLLENVVFIYLNNLGQEIYYYNDTAECDFVVKSQDKVVSLIQVTKSLKDEETRKREIKGLMSAMKKFNLNKGLILTFDEEDKIVIDNKHIDVIPIWKWFTSASTFRS